MRKPREILVAAVSLMFLIGVVPAPAQNKPQTSDAEYIAKAVSAAPKAVAKDAAIVRMDEGEKMTTLRQGKNGFTCMIVGQNKMCADANSMAFDAGECVQSLDSLVNALLPAGFACCYNDKLGSLEEESRRRV